MRQMASTAGFLLLVAPAARAAESFGDATYYLGDLHAHTGYSGDGGSADLGDCTGSCGNVADVFATAKSNGLDFVAITDHINSTPSISSTDWATLHAAVLAANDPASGFVTIPGGEIWFTLRGTNERLGHKTLLLFGDDTTLAATALSDVRIGSGSTVTACEDIWAYMETLTTSFGDAMLIPHHPAVRMPMHNDWACHDALWEPAVEIYSEHGNSLHDEGYDVPGEGIYTDYTVHAALDPDGYALSFGFVGGTDSHDTRPGAICDIDTEQPTHLYGGGLTVAVLDGTTSFERATIGEAIRARRTYVTTGPALPMAVRWSAGGLDLGGLGNAIDAPASLDLDVNVSVPSDRAGHVTAVELVGPDGQWSLADDGLGNWSGSVLAGDVPAWLYVAVQIDGASWYSSLGGCADGGDDVEWLWGSPSPITVWEDDVDGDGVSAWLDDCDDGDAGVNPSAVDTWYDGIDQDCAGDDDYDRDADGARARGWGTDCDDGDPRIGPHAAEVWYDGVDQDCDGVDDYDRDGDGERAAGWGDDCDDRDAAVGPHVEETWYDGVDNACDGGDDYDRDGDGEPAYPWGDDCDDTDAGVGSEAAEVWYDGVDQDCDGDGDSDADADGFDAVAVGGDDCDDSRADVFPGAPEVWYDGADNACDGGSDFDADADGFDAPVGGGPDCDDADPTISPTAADTWYDGVDQDCDGASDWDQDGDGFDSAAFGGLDCDDADAAAFPGNAERWYDGVDQDCDPATEYDADGDGMRFPLDCDDADPRRRACDEVAAAPSSCATVDGTSLGALAIAALLARRRRVRP